MDGDAATRCIADTSLLLMFCSTFLNNVVNVDFETKPRLETEVDNKWEAMGTQWFVPF